MAQWTVHYSEKVMDTLRKRWIKTRRVLFMTGLFDRKVTIIALYGIHGEVGVTEAAQESS